MITYNDAVRALSVKAAATGLDLVVMDFSRIDNPMLANGLALHVDMIARLPYVALAAGWEAGGILRLGFLVPSGIEQPALVHEALKRYAFNAWALECDSKVSRDFNCDYLTLNPDALTMEFNIEMMRRRSTSKWLTRASA